MEIDKLRGNESMVASSNSLASEREPAYEVDLSRAEKGEETEPFNIITASCALILCKLIYFYTQTF